MNLQFVTMIIMTHPTVLPGVIVVVLTPNNCSFNLYGPQQQSILVGRDSLITPFSSSNCLGQWMSFFFITIDN